VAARPRRPFEGLVRLVLSRLSPTWKECPRRGAGCATLGRGVADNRSILPANISAHLRNPILRSRFKTSWNLLSCLAASRRRAMGVGAGIGDGRAKSQPRRGVISIAGGHAPGNRAPSPPAPSPRWRGEGCRRRGVGSCPGVSPPATEIAALRGAGQPRPHACHPD